MKSLNVHEAKTQFSGLLAVLHTRCALLSGTFDAFWQTWNHTPPPCQLSA